MKANMGSADRAFRIVAAIIIGVLYYLNVITGTLGIILLIFAGIMLLTSLIRFCPLYVPIKLSTIRKKK